MGKKSVAAVIVVVVVVVGALLALSMSNNKSATYNSAQIYVTSWKMNSTEAPNVTVLFRMSLDLNGDGIYETVRTSNTFNQTGFELVPFHVGGPVNTQVQTFYFKIDVLRVLNGSETMMRYTDNGVSPVNSGSNIPGSSGSWQYDTQSGPLDQNCAIKYVYYTSEVPA
jgi:hypothetical protein